MLKIEVRPARPGERPAIDSIMAAATAQLRRIYRPTAQAVAQAKSAPVEWLVAECQGRLVGTLRYDRQDDRFHLGLGVVPDFQRQGVARLLIERLAAMARSSGARCLSLYTICQTGNVAIFERLGFAVVREAPAVGVESMTDQPLSEAYMEQPVTKK
jgi:GNAT superfamily N-acetyltransferase